VVAHIRNRRTSVNFLRFMNDVVRAYPDQQLHVVADNLNIHKNEAARRWLERHPRVQFHYTPTHASWVNLIECFFSILSKQGLAHGVQRFKQDLKDLLVRFLASYNATCSPFAWTKGPEHLQRIIETTKDYQAAHPRKPLNCRSETETLTIIFPGPLRGIPSTEVFTGFAFRSLKTGGKTAGATENGETQGAGPWACPAPTPRREIGLLPTLADWVVLPRWWARARYKSCSRTPNCSPDGHTSSSGD
jgi:transposase